MKTKSQGEFQVHLNRLSKAWLAGVLLLATPVFAGTILPGHGSGSPGRTDWNVPGPLQILIDTSGVSACSGVGQTTSFIGGPSRSGDGPGGFQTCALPISVRPAARTGMSPGHCRY